ncbi:hypothetical protein BGW39_007688, partial [Mortierella sp. 14UC]
MANFYGCFRQGQQLCIAMELGIEDLFTLRRRHRGVFPVSAAAIIAREIATTLRFIHSQGYCHRDVKPQNIIITASGAIKLLDFGVAERLNARHQAKQVGGFGTRGYMAPEVTKGWYNDILADSYSFGGLIYFLVTDNQPVVKKEEQEEQEEEKKEERKNVINATRYPLAAAIFERLLDPNPLTRMNIKQALVDPYLTTVTGQPVPIFPRTVEQGGGAAEQGAVAQGLSLGQEAEPAAPAQEFEATGEEAEAEALPQKSGAGAGQEGEAGEGQEGEA